MLNEFFNGGGADDSYIIERSLRLSSEDSAHLTRTPSSAGSRTTWTWSAWVKRGKLGFFTTLFSTSNGTGGVSRGGFSFHSNDKLKFWSNPSGSSETANFETDAVFRDASAWYHIVLAVDTTQSTNTDRIKLYVNGEQQSFSSATYMAQNEDAAFNQAFLHTIGSYQNLDYGDYLLADVNFVDGVPGLTADDFGEYNDDGVWQPKAFEGEYDRGANQSEVWSSTSTVTYIGDAGPGNTTTIANVFDGNTATGFYVLGTASTPSLVYRLTFSSPIRGSKVRVYTGGDGGAGAAINGVNSGDLVATPSYSWTTIYEGTEKDIDWISLGAVAGTADSVICAIEIDGKILVDSGIALTDNSFHLEFSDNSSDAALGTDSSGFGNNWTPNNLVAVAVNYVASTGGEAPYAGSWDQMFNGVLTGGPYVYNQTSSVTFSVPLTGTIEILTDLPGTYQGNPTTYTLSTGAVVSKSTIAQQWINFGQQTNVTSLEVNGPDPGAYISAIRVDGAVLTTKDPSEADSLIDSPTNYESKSGGNNGGGYCTMNPLDAETSNIVFSQGNLTVSQPTNIGWGMTRSTMRMDSGAWYWEVLIDSLDQNASVGLATADAYNYFSVSGGYAAHPGYGVMNDGQVWGFAYDADNGTIDFYRDGALQTGYSRADAPPGLFAAVALYGPYSSSSEPGFTFNFGQQPFRFTPPAGYLSVCTANLPDPVIADGSTAMNVALYEGNGTSQSITGLGYSPDLVWIKSRTLANSHVLWDTVRGTGKYLQSSSSAAEATNLDGVTSFDSDGFSLGAFNNVNQLTDDFVAWTWDAGSSNTTVATDANGSGLPGAECVYRANTTAGFSIVRVASPTATQARVHGLNKKPDMIICKSTGSADSWHTYHSSLGYTKYINLNGSGSAASSDQFGSQEPTSTYFYVKPATGSGANKIDGMIYLIWTAVEGYSAFGSYEGSGSATNGSFVYTGMRPAYLLIKRTDNQSSWYIFDSARSPINVVDDRIQAHSNNAENTNAAWSVDFLSNGFKLRTTEVELNASGGQYIYAAFAEHPLRHARAR